MDDHAVTSIAAEMSDGIAAIAGPRLPSDNRKSWLARAAGAAGISSRMAKALYYGEVADPKASVLVRVRAARDRAEEQKALVNAEHAKLLARIADLENWRATFDRPRDHEGGELAG